MCLQCLNLLAVLLLQLLHCCVLPRLSAEDVEAALASKRSCTPHNHYFSLLLHNPVALPCRLSAEEVEAAVASKRAELLAEYEQEKESGDVTK
jgi:hypothetical protein